MNISGHGLTSGHLLGSDYVIDRELATDYGIKGRQQRTRALYFQKKKKKKSAPGPLQVCILRNHMAFRSVAVNCRSLPGLEMPADPTNNAIVGEITVTINTVITTIYCWLYEILCSILKNIFSLLLEILQGRDIKTLPTLQWRN